MDLRRAFRELVADGHGVEDAATGKVTLAVASRLFPCPGCIGKVQLAIDARGRMAALHSLPPCGHYDGSDEMEQILGAENFALLGEEWWT